MQHKRPVDLTGQSEIVSTALRSANTHHHSAGLAHQELHQALQNLPVDNNHTRSFTAPRTTNTINQLLENDHTMVPT